MPRPTLRLVANADRERRLALARKRRQRHKQGTKLGLAVLDVRVDVNAFSEALLVSRRVSEAEKAHRYPGRAAVVRWETTAFTTESAATSVVNTQDEAMTALSPMVTSDSTAIMVPNRTWLPTLTRPESDTDGPKPQWEPTMQWCSIVVRELRKFYRLPNREKMRYALA